MQSLLREAQVFLEQISLVKKSIVSNLKRLEMFWGIPNFFFVYLIFKESQQLRLQCRISRLEPWVGKIPWRRAWQPTPMFLPGESPWTEEPCGLRSMGSQRDMTEPLSAHPKPHRIEHRFKSGFTNKGMQASLSFAATDLSSALISLHSKAL